MLRTLTHPGHAPAASVWAFTAVLVLLGATASAQTADSRRSGDDDPFGRDGWHLELSGHAALETWNYNGSHEEMYGIVPGITYGIRDGLVLTAGGPLYYVDQRGVDAWLLGVTIGVRGRILGKGRVASFWEFEVGVSEADTYTPPRGTRFNYLALGGAGATVRIRSGVHLIAAVKWTHVSNNGLAGRHRNPDIEAVGPRIGVLLGF
jgi:hypothetical protein